MRPFDRFVPYRKRKLCFFDVETTGTKPGYHELTEIAFIHEEKGGLCLQIAPQHMDRAEPEALMKSRYNVSDWVDAQPLKELMPRIMDHVGDDTLVGHNNAGFDLPMVRGNLDMCGIGHDRLFRDSIDTMMLARAFLVPLGLNLIGLGPCMKFIGEEYEGAHNAYEDAKFTEKLYRYITNGLKWHGKKDGKQIQEALL